jgi:DNA-binding NarL/FixJ family response regulator
VTVVFLLDDHESSAAALRTSSGQSDLEVVGEAGTAEEAYGRIRRPPECRILDVNLPDG